MSLNTAILESLGLPAPVEEYAFADSIGRKWRWDTCWVDVKLSIEFQGGIWRKGGGAHTGSGHTRDMEKLNAAAELGWTVLQYTPQNINYSQIQRVYERLSGIKKKPKKKADYGRK